eukprot:gene7234-11549_t
METNSNTSSSASTTNNNYFIQTFFKLQEFVTQLNGKLLFGNVTTVLVFFISFFQLFTVSLSSKFIYGEYTSIVLKYITYISRLPAFGMPYYVFIVVFGCFTLFPLMIVICTLVMSEFVRYRKILFQIFGTILYIFCHVFYIPTLSISLSFFNCNFDQSTLYYFPDFQCWEFPNTILLAFSILSLFTTVLINIVYFMLIFERFNSKFHGCPDNRFFLLLLIYKTLLVLSTDLIPKYQIITAIIGILSSISMIIYLHYFMPFYYLVVNLLYMAVFTWNLSSYFSGFIVECFYNYSSFTREFFILIVSIAPILFVAFTLSFIIRREIFKLYIHDILNHDEKKKGKYIFEENSSLVDVLAHMTNSKTLQRKIYETRLKNGYSFRTKLFYALFLIYETELTPKDRQTIGEMTTKSYISSLEFLDSIYLQDYCIKKRTEINLNSNLKIDTMLELQKIHRYQLHIKKSLTNFWKRYLVNIVNFDVFPSIISTLQHYETLSDQSFLKLIRDDGKNVVVLRNYSIYLEKVKKDFEQAHAYKKLADKQEEVERKNLRDILENKEKQEDQTDTAASTPTLSGALPKARNFETDSSKTDDESDYQKKRKRSLPGRKESTVSLGLSTGDTSINGEEKERYQVYLERISSSKSLPPVILFLFILFLSVFCLTILCLAFANSKELSKRYTIITEETTYAGIISQLFLSTATNLRYLQLSLIPGQNYNTTYFKLVLEEEILKLEDYTNIIYEDTINEKYVSDLWKTKDLISIHNSETSSTLTKISLLDGTMGFISELKKSISELQKNNDGKLLQKLSDFRNLNLNARHTLIDGFELLKGTLLKAQKYHETIFIIFACLLGFFAFVIPPIVFVLVFFYIKHEQLKVFKLIVNVPKSAISNIYKSYASRREEDDLNDEDEERENLILASLTSDSSDSQIPIMRQFIFRFLVYFIAFIIFTFTFTTVGSILEREFRDDTQFLIEAEKRNYLINRIHFNSLETALYSTVPNLPLNISSINDLRTYLISDRKLLQNSNNILRIGSTELDIQGTDGIVSSLQKLNYDRSCNDAHSDDCLSLSDLFLKFFDTIDHLLYLNINYDISNSFFKIIKKFDEGILSKKSLDMTSSYFLDHLGTKNTFENVLDVVFAFAIIFVFAYSIVFFVDAPIKLSREFLKAKRLFLHFPTKVLDANQLLKEFLQGKQINLEKQKQIAVKESNEKFDAILENSDDAVIQFNSKLKIISLNKSAINMFDIKEEPKKYVGHRFSEIFSESSQEIFIKNFNPSDHTLNKRVFTQDLEILVHDQRYSVNVTISVDKNFIAFIKDITARKNQESLLNFEKDRASQLLYDILPVKIAKKKTENKKQIIVDSHKECTILFADICGFTDLSSKMKAEELVNMLNDLFKYFDDSCAIHGIEKIKTIGDCYMCASGIPDYRRDHAEAMMEFAKSMLESVEEYNKLSGRNIQIRIGINSGRVVAGVIGKRKYAYDLWGDSVNIASRMESSGVPQKIHISRSTYVLIHKRYHCKELKEIEIKGKGKMKTYMYQGTVNDIKNKI